MAKTTKSAAPKKKSAPVKAAPKTTAKAPAKKAVKPAAKAAPKSPAKPAAKPVAKAAVKPSAKPVAKAPAKAAPKMAVKPEPKPAAKAPVVAAPGLKSAKGSGKVPAKPVAAKAPTVELSKKPNLKIVEPKVTPSVMSKVPAEESVAEEAAAPKKKRSEKDPLAGLDKIADPTAKWEALSAKATLIPTAPYKMSGSFEPKTGLQHKVLGWGYVLSALNDRLEVLFKDGVRILISNYKAP